MKQVSLPWSLRALRGLEFPHKLGICERVFGRRLGSYGVGWVETSTGIAWKLDLANPTHRWIVFGKYEGRAFIDWATGYLRPDATVVDSGANIGQMLLYLAPCVSRGRVLAFEPGIEAADWLQECLERHPDFPVTLRRQGLGERDADLLLEPLGPAGSHGSWNRISGSKGAPVRVVRLDGVADQLGIQIIDLWKLDVEGHEASALEGAKNLLRDARIRALYVELGFGNGARIVEQLGEFGYRAHVFDGRGRVKPLSTIPDHANALFLPAGA